jgi:GrpB-like predicted nucleotidyltransferase (UPF0157 family)
VSLCPVHSPVAWLGIAVDRLRFRPAHTLSGPIRRGFAEERSKILLLLPGAEVLHTGATSVPAALTRGDLDIHVRVPSGDFPRATDALAGTYASYRTEMWTPGFATFVVPNRSIPTGIALTTIGGEHDQRFLLAWDRLSREPQLLQELNALKLTYDESDDAASYESAKSAFFSSLVTSDSEPPSPER